MAQIVPVSVVMPVFNHARFLERALGAIAAQRVPPHEVIVIDDASSDDSAAAAEAFRSVLEPRTRLTVLRNEQNLGVNGSLNRGIGHATGSWICCTAADDWLEPGYIEAMGGAAAQFPQARIVTSPYVEFIEAENRIQVHDARSDMGIWYAGPQSAFFDAEAFAALLKKGHVAVPVSASLIRADALRALGGYDPDLRWHSDWFAAYAIALRHGLAVVCQPMAVFRIAAGTFSGDNVRHVERQRAVCNAIVDKLDGPGFADVRAALRRTPAPFAPFVRHMLPALAARAQDRDLFIATALWWLNEARKGRRPGALRRIVEKLGFNTAPKA